jgi:hypothetical protein
MVLRSLLSRLMSSNIAKKQFNLSSLAAVQQGLAADGLNTLAMTQTPLPPLKPKPLDLKIEAKNNG